MPSPGTASHAFCRHCLPCLLQALRPMPSSGTVSHAFSRHWQAMSHRQGHATRQADTEADRSGKEADTCTDRPGTPCLLQANWLAGKLADSHPSFRHTRNERNLLQRAVCRMGVVLAAGAVGAAGAVVVAVGAGAFYLVWARARHRVSPLRCAANPTQHPSLRPSEDLLDPEPALGLPVELLLLPFLLLLLLLLALRGG